MKIKMTQSLPGSLDGVTVIDLAAGQEYETVDSARGTRLALAHIRKGVAVAVAVPDIEPVRSEVAPAAVTKSKAKPALAK
ncbi:hypothetical protein [Janthinobacterium aquaticum]|uniref:hypothetical protein n=1 Tax=Janthinobacterium sp. FT58W TaxID=2654254 RepID=UPI001264829A|nr:hypothetical protein [Janthinobacterium sp. FT58W]KAB8042555.1 hypothetical protein GCM43_13605 [Janthinobacterium sp. FT58W]